MLFRWGRRSISPTMNPSIGSLLLTVGLWVALAVFCCSGTRSTAKELTQEHRDAIRAGLRAEGLPNPANIEMTDGGWIVVTYQLSNGLQARAIAEQAVLATREAMLPYRLTESYRVTVNGPSPGTGLITRYGSARFTDRLDWQSGLD